jgi:hypothetical protein
MQTIKPKLITVKPITKEKTGIAQAFDEFVKNTDLKFTKLNKK